MIYALLTLSVFTGFILWRWRVAATKNGVLEAANAVSSKTIETLRRQVENLTNPVSVDDAIDELREAAVRQHGVSAVPSADD